MTPTAQTGIEIDMGPLVTIAIPTFNRSSWLKGCVQAALAQTYANFEVLVSDNASVDDTAMMLKEFDDPRLRVIRQPENIGLLPNWNACLSAAKGEYISVVSDDDLVSPSFLERSATLIRQEPDLPIVVVQSDVQFFPEGTVRKAAPNIRYSTGIWKGTDILNEFLLGRISAQMCGIIGRTAYFRDGGGFKLDFPHAGDIVSWTPLLLIGRAGYVDEGCVTYRVHASARTSDFSDDSRIEELNRFAEFLSLKAEAAIADGRTRQKVKSNAGFYVANSALYRIDMRRKAGAGSAEIIKALWAWRKYWAGSGASNLTKLTKPLAYLFMPEAMTRTVRSLFGKTSR
jgi:glycosyltransferase involved in cell wall biosynthesis